MAPDWAQSVVRSEDTMQYYETDPRRFGLRLSKRLIEEDRYQLNDEGQGLAKGERGLSLFLSHRALLRARKACLGHGLSHASPRVLRPWLKLQQVSIQLHFVAS